MDHNENGHAPVARRRPRRTPTLDVERLSAHWDLGEWNEWRRTDKGSANVSIFVESSRGRFVLRLSNERKTEAGIAQEVLLLDHLRARGFPCPKVVATRTDDPWARVDGVFCLVTERLPGTYLDIFDPVHLAETARAMAWYHAEARLLPEAARPAAGSDLPALAQVPQVLAELDELVSGVAGPAGQQRFRRAVAALDSGHQRVTAALSEGGPLPEMVTHGSLGYSAVLFTGPDVTAILDYERAATEARALDLAYTLRALARSRDVAGAFDMAKIRLFMAAYQEREPVPEAARLPLVLRIQRFLKIRRKAANLLRQHSVVPQEEKDAMKFLDMLDEEVVRLRWLEDHADELSEAMSGG